MKTQTKSHKHHSDTSHKKQNQEPSSQERKEITGENISTNSSKEDPNKPKRLGESQTEITDETTI